jgi:hypothetical protein
MTYKRLILNQSAILVGYNHHDKSLTKDKNVMNRDFGSGLSVDELIGVTAYYIMHLELPPGEVFENVNKAARVLIANDFESCMLMEIWEDGHTVWVMVPSGAPIWVTPTGQIVQTKK